MTRWMWVLLLATAGAAIWLLPRTGNWPHDGEIDIMEHHGSDPVKVNAAIHFANADGRLKKRYYEELVQQ